MASFALNRSAAPRFVVDRLRAALLKRLQALYRRPLELRLNNNRLTYFSVRFPRGQPARLSLHRCFAEAPDDVVAAVVRMIAGRGPAARDSAAQRICREFVRRCEERAAHANPAPPPVRRRVKGRWHDLAELAAAVNRRYFDGALNIRITWGRRAELRDERARRTIQFGAYDQALDLVRIHPLLDSPDTPRFYLDYLIYHELLHKVLGWGHGAGRGRRQVHHPEFRRREREHAQYAEAIAWEKQFFKRLAERKRTVPKQSARASRRIGGRLGAGARPRPAAEADAAFTPPAPIGSPGKAAAARPRKGAGKAAGGASCEPALFVQLSLFDELEILR